MHSVPLSICKTETEISPAIIEWLYEHSAGVISIVVSLIHDAQEIAILNGTEELNLDALDEAYENRLSLLHSYIDPNIQRRPQCGTAKRETVVVPLNLKQQTGERKTISDLATIAKNEGNDIVKLLKQHMTVVEVAV